MAKQLWQVVETMPDGEEVPRYTTESVGAAVVVANTMVESGCRVEVRPAPEVAQD